MLNKNGETERVCVVSIDDLIPIKGADHVEIAMTGEKQVLVRKGQFQKGDLAVYFEADSKVPKREPFLFLKSKNFCVKSQKYFKGTVISEGLLMAGKDLGYEIRRDRSGRVTAIGDHKKGDFLTKELRVSYSNDIETIAMSTFWGWIKICGSTTAIIKKGRLLGADKRNLRGMLDYNIFVWLAADIILLKNWRKPSQNLRHKTEDKLRQQIEGENKASIIYRFQCNDRIPEQIRQKLAIVTSLLSDGVEWTVSERNVIFRFGEGYFSWPLALQEAGETGEIGWKYLIDVMEYLSDHAGLEVECRNQTDEILCSSNLNAEIE